MLCSRCNKNVAVIFVTRMENGRTINEGLCMPCAGELGINSMQQLAGGMDLDDMENLEVNFMYAETFTRHYPNSTKTIACMVIELEESEE